MSRRPLDAGKPEEVVVRFDLVNEQAVVAAGLLDDGARAGLVRSVEPGLFQSDKHREAWSVVVAMAERGISYDQMALRSFCEPALAEYLEQLAKGGAPRNVSEHVGRLRWDAARMRAASTALPAFLERFRDPRGKPEAVQAAAADLAECFNGYGDASAIPQRGRTAEEQAVEIRMRMAGKAAYPYGIPGLDENPDGTPLMVPGAAPRKITIVTGVSGSGKSMLAVMMALGLYRQRRRVLYGAWEPGVGNVLEAIACMECGLRRTAFKTGTCTDAEARQHAECMREVEEHVVLFNNPFRQGRVEEARGERGRWQPGDTNQRRIDVLAQYVERSGCEVFIADLLRRSFARFSDPNEEERAMYAVQEMVDRTGVHLVGLHQQVLKGEAERRVDKRPTREGLKGSGAWLDVSDAVIGVHREHLFKNVADDQMELHVLKQRDGRWPVAINFRYDPDYATLTDGKQFDYRAAEGPGDLGEGLDSAFREPKGKGKAVKRHLRPVDDDLPY